MDVYISTKWSIDISEAQNQPMTEVYDEYTKAPYRKRPENRLSVTFLCGCCLNFGVVLATEPRHFFLRWVAGCVVCVAPAGGQYCLCCAHAEVCVCVYVQVCNNCNNTDGSLLFGGCRSLFVDFFIFMFSLNEAVP